MKWVSSASFSLMSSSGFAGFFFYISQIFVVSMVRSKSLCSNGVGRSKACGGFGRWRVRLLPLLVFGCIVGSLWVFFEVQKDGILRWEEKVIRVLWEEKIQLFREQFNLSKSKLQSMAMFFSSADQFSVPPSNSVALLSLSGFAVVSLVASYDSQHLVVVSSMKASNWKSRRRFIDCASILNSRVTANCNGEQNQNLPKLLIICFVIMGMVLSSIVVPVYRNLFNLSNKLLHQQQYEPHNLKAGGRWRKRILFMGIFLGMSVSVWIYFSMNATIVARRKETLTNMCDERARMLQDQFNVSLNHVNALAILISTFHHGKNPSAIDQNWKCLVEVYDAIPDNPENRRHISCFITNCIFPLPLRYTDLVRGQQLVSEPSPGGKMMDRGKEPATEEVRTLEMLWANQESVHCRIDEVAADVQRLTVEIRREFNLIRARPTYQDRHREEARVNRPIPRRRVDGYTDLVRGQQFRWLTQNKTFAEYTARTAFERPLTSGVAYALKVLHSEREQFEKEHGWSIKKMETEDQSPVKDDYAPEKLDPSPAQEEYAPVIFTQETVSHIVSVDMMSGRERLLQQLASKQTIIVNVYDTTNSSASIKMYGPDDVSGRDDVHISYVDFGDPTRRHAMHCRFKHEPPPPWSAITTSLGVAVIVLLVGHIFNAAINRIEKVEDDYREMKELKVRAEAADVAKSQFLATVSHEIRTPMNGVLGMLQMLLDTDLDSTQQDFAMTAQASGKALISLINEVLDQAKIESGRLELEAVPFDVRAVLDNVLSLFSDKSQAKGIELAVYISNQVPEVLIGDPWRFRQVITNLVGNSVKFTEEGHIFVSVHLIEEMKRSCDVDNHVCRKGHDLVENGMDLLHNTLSGFHVVDRCKSWENFRMFESNTEATDVINILITVEDTGVGIPLDAQNHIFMPFMQADSSTSRMYGGTGIGLSISKCLVDLMGGEIGFVSEPGVGSSFSFTAVFREGWKNSVDMKRQQSEITVSDFRGMTGLVVDGRSIRADVTKYHLQRLGIEVEVATNPESALSKILDACSPR
ncbi:hypothetical protein IEQ34_003266 [Dendrobium chrysotoxum]|uniref:histidine kinase n=1 Tax=Dendrobium chrysotoxum TaxID=161865 RepID=A0AAV7HKS9_DENCH|nr:hypothetical protein IEQ34_003266 [Dendrobium chrysotoxum]